MPTAMPACIFSALSPAGNAGSEKSTVSGVWPTNNICFIDTSPSRNVSTQDGYPDVSWNSRMP
jgi:hypothetical protein